jgi:hypothetical protein
VIVAGIARKQKSLTEAEVFELVAALFDDPIVINPDVAVSR